MENRNLYTSQNLLKLFSFIHGGHSFQQMQEPFVPFTFAREQAQIVHQNARYAYLVANRLVQALCNTFPPSPIVHNVVPWPWQHSKEMLQCSLGFLEWNDHGGHEHRTTEMHAIDAKCFIIFRDIE